MQHRRRQSRETCGDASADKCPPVCIEAARYFPIAFGVMACVLLSAFQQCLAQPKEEINHTREYNVKAVFLFNFGRYIDWPTRNNGNANRDFILGILGDDPFDGALDKIAKIKRIDGRPIVIRRWKTLEQYKPCQILFVPKTTSPDQRAAAIAKLATKSVLVVGETSGFAKQGGTMEFFIEGKNVRFKINIDTVNRQRLTIDGKLVTLATIIKRK